MNKIMNKTNAFVLCLLMATMSLAGCVGDEDDNVDKTITELDDWNVHYAASAADLPNCDGDTIGRLYYVEDSNQFQVCKAGGWDVISIQGNSGANGQDGLSGVDGLDGEDGTSILITAVPSISCSNGGNTFNIGPDVNQNGFLESAEFVMTIDVCNGADGSDGQDGEQGPRGFNGTDGQDGVHGYSSLILTTNEPAGNNCANDGIKIETGIDFNRDGHLNASEIDTVQYICGYHSNSNNSYSSNPNNMLTTVEDLSPSAECNDGERIVSHGLDNGENGGISSNGILETGEIDHSTKYCKHYEFVISQLANTTISINNNDMIIYNNDLYFSAYNFTTGNELWKFSSGEFSLVADINSGSGSSSPSNFIIFNDELYFSANDGTHGHELWKHNDTDTSMVYDLAQGFHNGMYSYHGNSVTVYDDKLFFIGRNSSINWYEGRLSYYDGNNPPTILPGGGNRAGTLTNFGDGIYYGAENGSYDLVLWKYDTNNQSEVVVNDIEISQDYDGGNHMFVFDNELYFSASDGTHGHELMKLVVNNQTGDALAVLIADISPGFSSYPKNFASFNDQLYFQADDGTHGYELWKYDGSTASMVADLNQGYLGGTNSSNLVVFENNLFFSGSINGTHIATLYAYDGINQPVDITNGDYRPGNKYIYNNEMIFVSYNYLTGNSIDSMAYATSHTISWIL